ncbi:hypothetical protein MNBD_GAMMA12-1236, partial [hydrothermal vent metagenome]
GLAMIESMRGNRSEAEYLVRKALKLDPQSWSALYVKSILATKTDSKVSDEILSELMDKVPEGSDRSLKDTLSSFFKKNRPKNLNSSKSQNLH